MSKNLKNKIAEGCAVALVIIGILVFAYGLSWIVTCGILSWLLCALVGRLSGALQQVFGWLFVF